MKKTVDPFVLSRRACTKLALIFTVMPLILLLVGEAIFQVINNDKLAHGGWTSAQIHFSNLTFGVAILVSAVSFGIAITFWVLALLYKNRGKI